MGKNPWPLRGNPLFVRNRDGFGKSEKIKNQEFSEAFDGGGGTGGGMWVQRGVACVGVSDWGEVW